MYLILKATVGNGAKKRKFIIHSLQESNFCYSISQYSGQPLIECTIKSKTYTVLQSVETMESEAKEVGLRISHEITEYLHLKPFKNEDLHAGNAVYKGWPSSSTAL